MRIIPLTHSEKVAYIDDADYPKVSDYRWRLHSTPRGSYARAWIDGQNVLMHRFILNAPDDIDVDHKDGNGLDNRRYNIRSCNCTQNGQNRRSALGSTSKYKGVSLHKSTGKWQAQITVNGKNKGLGLFDDEDDAARAYNNAAMINFGTFARLNVITERGETLQLFG